MIKHLDPLLGFLLLLLLVTIVLSFLSIAHGVNPLPLMEIVFPAVITLVSFAVGVTMARS